MKMQNHYDPDPEPIPQETDCFAANCFLDTVRKPILEQRLRFKKFRKMFLKQVGLWRWFKIATESERELVSFAVRKVWHYYR